LLVRRDYFGYLRGTFPKMQTYLVDYGTADWYCKTFNIDANGAPLKGSDKPMSADMDEDAEENMPSEPVASSYTCLKPLTILCESLLQSIN